MRSAIFLLLLFASGFIFFGCSSDNSISGKEGTLRVSLTDAPANLKELWVTISSVEVHETGGGWKTISNSIDNLDILTLKNSEQLLVATALDDGVYTGIRLQIAAGHIIERDNSRCDLKIPSDKLEVPFRFEIKEGKTTKVLLDFKGEQSVHVVEKGNNEQCVLRPVLLPVSAEHD